MVSRIVTATSLAPFRLFVTFLTVRTNVLNDGMLIMASPFAAEGAGAHLDRCT